MASWRAEHLKQQQVTPLRHMITDSDIAACPLHVTPLAFPEVAKNAFGPTILVTMLATSGASKDQDR
jgi:hypothetical protein